MLVLLPTFAPGFDEFGYPQIFDYNGAASDDLICLAEWVVVLQVLGAVMGIFRLPPASPLIRRVGMTSAATAIVQLSYVAISSFNGTHRYLFDAFQGPFMLMSIFACFWAIKANFDFVDAVLSDKEKKGWDTVPCEFY